MTRRAVLVFLAMLAGVAMALEPDTSVFVGSRRGSFLGLGVGARPIGMAEAYTALADDATASFWNPGGLGRMETLHAAAMYDAAGQGVGLSYAALAEPVGRGVVAGSLTILSFGDFIRRSDTGDRLATSSVSDLAFTASYAIRHPQEVGVPGYSGITLEYVSESVAGSMLGLSLGSIIPLAQGLTGGWVLQHLSIPSGGFTLPAMAKLGLAWEAMPELSAMADIGFGLAGQGMAWAVGTEYRPIPILAVRAGYRGRTQETMYQGLSGVTAGLGFRLASFGLDYAFQPRGELATSHLVSLTYGLPMAGASKEADQLAADAAASQAAGDFPAAQTKAEAALRLKPNQWQALQTLGNCLYARKDSVGALAAWKKSLSANPDNKRLKTTVSRLQAELTAPSTPVREKKKVVAAPVEPAGPSPAFLADLTKKLSLRLQVLEDRLTMLHRSGFEPIVQTEVERATSAQTEAKKDLTDKRLDDAESHLNRMSDWLDMARDKINDEAKAQLRW